MYGSKFRLGRSQDRPSRRPCGIADVESKSKPTLPAGEIAQAAFGETAPAVDLGRIWQTIVALGQQDTDPTGLAAPDGFEIVGASSDHLIVDTG